MYVLLYQTYLCVISELENIIHAEALGMNPAPHGHTVLSGHLLPLLKTSHFSYPPLSD